MSTDDRANVVPIDGFWLPPPPEWRLTDEATHQRRLAAQVIAPEDLTVRGMPRCVARSAGTGIRCANEVERGSVYCRFHARSNAGRDPDEPSITKPPDGSAGNLGTRARADRLDAVRTQLELVANSAVLAIQAVLEADNSRPQDRLKAAEIVLDRTVGRQIQLEQVENAERDIDREILALADSLEATGTDGDKPKRGKRT